jgi:hypothetical protein
MTSKSSTGRWRRVLLANLDKMSFSISNSKLKRLPLRPTPIFLSLNKLWPISLGKIHACRLRDCANQSNWSQPKTPRRKYSSKEAKAKSAVSCKNIKISFLKQSLKWILNRKKIGWKITEKSNRTEKAVFRHGTTIKQSKILIAVPR